MLRLLNVATPRDEVTVLVPDSVPPPGLAPIATLTLLVYVVSALPLEFCATTTTAGVITRPAVVLVGWTVNARWVAVPPEPTMPMTRFIAVSHAAASAAAAIMVTCALRMGRSLRLPPVTLRFHIMRNARPGRYVRLQLPRVEGAVLSAQAASLWDAQLLRRAAAHGRDQLHILPDAQRQNHRRVERGDAAAVHLRAEGTEAHHARFPAQVRGQAPRLLLRHRRRARPQARTPAVSAAPELQEGRRPPEIGRAHV